MTRWWPPVVAIPVAPSRRNCRSNDRPIRKNCPQPVPNAPVSGCTQQLICRVRQGDRFTHAMLCAHPAVPIAQERGARDRSPPLAPKDRVGGTGLEGTPFHHHPRIVQTRSAMKHPPAAIDGFGEQDIHLFREGTHAQLYRKLGCHLGAEGARFAVWAPNASAVSVIGDFNDWRGDAHPAQARSDGSGIWELQVPAVQPGQHYKFASARATAPCSTRPTRSRAAPSCRRPPARWCGARRLRLERRRLDARARATQRARRADVGLRGAPGFVAARRGRPLLDYRRSGSQLAEYARAWASPMSS